jgi:hypothetical protein
MPPPPSRDQDARLGEAIEEFVAQAALERFVIAILRWAAGRDMEHHYADPDESFLNSGREKSQPLSDMTFDGGPLAMNRER